MDPESGGEVIDQDQEGLEVINQASEEEDVGQDELDMRDLYSGVQSLIQGGDQNLMAEEVQLTKPGLNTGEAEKEEDKQLYEVLPEVNL